MLLYASYTWRLVYKVPFSKGADESLHLFAHAACRTIDLRIVSALCLIYKGFDYFVKVFCFESVIITKKWRNFDKNSLKELKQIEVKKWKNSQTLFEKTSKKHVFQTFKPKPFFSGETNALRKIWKTFLDKNWKIFSPKLTIRYVSKWR